MSEPDLTKKETALRALLAALETLPALFEEADWSLGVSRNATALTDFREEGGHAAHLVLRDGDTGEPAEIELSPPLYHYEHTAKLVLQVTKARPDADAIFDRVQLALADLFDDEGPIGDTTLGGTVDYVELGGLNTEEVDEAFEVDWKATILPLTIFYSSPKRLG